MSSSNTTYDANVNADVIIHLNSIKLGLSDQICEDAIIMLVKVTTNYTSLDTSSLFATTEQGSQGEDHLYGLAECRSSLSPASYQTRFYKIIYIISMPDFLDDSVAVTMVVATSCTLKYVDFQTFLLPQSKYESDST
jgi:hypothetical protein